MKKKPTSSQMSWPMTSARCQGSTVVDAGHGPACNATVVAEEPVPACNAATAVDEDHVPASNAAMRNSSAATVDGDTVPDSNVAIRAWSVATKASSEAMRAGGTCEGGGGGCWAVIANGKAPRPPGS